mgnify:CR=1 FL=1
MSAPGNQPERACIYISDREFNISDRALNISEPEFKISEPEFNISVSEIKISVSGFNISVSEFNISVSEFNISLPEWNISLPASNLNVNEGIRREEERSTYLPPANLLTSTCPMRPYLVTTTFRTKYPLAVRRKT